MKYYNETVSQPQLNASFSKGFLDHLFTATGHWESVNTKSLLTDGQGWEPKTCLNF